MAAVANGGSINDDEPVLFVILLVLVLVVALPALFMAFGSALGVLLGALVHDDVERSHVSSELIETNY